MRFESFHATQTRHFTVTLALARIFEIHAVCWSTYQPILTSCSLIAWNTSCTR